MIFLLFVILAIALLSIDIYAHRRAEPIPLKNAILWSVFYVVGALFFAGILFFYRGANSASLFLTGWALEKMLAVDNLVVFAAIFSYFKIPDKYQHKALHWGIIGAVIFRLVFVYIGVSMIDYIGPTMDIVFAVVIIYTAYMMATKNVDEDVNYIDTWYGRLLKSRLYISHSDKFFVIRDGLLRVTPLFMAVVAIEISDLMFSFDSVPAVIAVTKDPLLVYSAMIFAILGLRSLYFVLSALMRYLRYLETAVIVVLSFISIKLIVGAVFDVHIPPAIALLTTLSILMGGVFLSLLANKRGNDPCSLQ